MNKKSQTNRKEEIKMKMVFIAILIVVTLGNVSSAFAYWKSPAGLEDPAPSPFKESQF